MPVSIKTDFPFCYDSEDYKQPCGSAHDYHTNPLFIQRSELLFRTKLLFVLDLGCANGTMIVDYINKGHLGIGIDGSDYGVKNKTGGWGTHPENFFNADIAKPFTLLGDSFDDPILFEIVTAWEVLEHIKEEDLPQFFQNIKKHTYCSSLCFFSIALFESGAYHQNVKNEQWWRNYLSNDWIIYDELMQWWTLKEWVRQDEGPAKRFHVIIGPKNV
jgi:cyclopropane fatty-acyl-phospholipid synthase-like methyltransferase